MDISIVIVNWNTRELLGNCLASIARTVHGLRYEIIVVDNASSDDSVAMLREKHPQVRVIENAENRGFGAANNQAFAVIEGRYVLLLNTDTVLTENAVHELFSFMETHKTVGIAGGQLLNEDGSKQNSIAHIPTLLTLLANTSLLEYLWPARFPSKRYEHLGPIEVDSVIGACMLVRKEAMDAVGMFDERYFFFFEETDWAYQMKSGGWNVYHVPTARIYHLQGQSIGRNVRSRIEFYRSRYTFFRKWKSGPYTSAVSGIIILRLAANWLFTLIGTAGTFVLHRRLRDKLIVYTQLLLWHLKGCP
jgi:GT2 family glycosyltransferase